MSGFWYDYIKPKYRRNAKLSYMDTDSFIMHTKSEDVYKDIVNDVRNKFDTSNYGIKRPLPTGKNINVIGLMNDELDNHILRCQKSSKLSTHYFFYKNSK